MKMTNNEIRQKFAIRRLGVNDEIQSFDCGDMDLNNFIQNDSKWYRKALLAVSYVLRDKQHNSTVGYFSLANDSLSLTNFTSKAEFNRFRKKRFVNEKRLKTYPAAKICRLGIDEVMKGQSLGTFILDFIKSYFVKNNKTGCRFLTVDAYAAAVPFYIKNGFLPLTPDDEDSRTRSLYFDLNDIADE